jgi:hypothetical protein
LRGAASGGAGGGGVVLSNNTFIPHPRAPPAPHSMEAPDTSRVKQLINPQRNFSEVMLFERRLCGSRLLKWKNAVNVHFEWACLDQLI